MKSLNKKAMPINLSMIVENNRGIVKHYSIKSGFRTELVLTGTRLLLIKISPKKEQI